MAGITWPTSPRCAGGWPGIELKQRLTSRTVPGIWLQSRAGASLFEYLLQVPANRIGYTALSLSQLKILQEVITLLVFAPFAVLYMRQPLKVDYLWAALCRVGAVYFTFRSPPS
jgi:uncharacterized protein